MNLEEALNLIDESKRVDEVTDLLSTLTFIERRQVLEWLFNYIGIPYSLGLWLDNAQEKGIAGTCEVLLTAKI